MRTLALSPMDRLAGFAPLVARVIVGVIMTAHGFQKLAMGPGAFGQGLAQMGVPAPTLMGYVVTFVELVGGILLIVGILHGLNVLSLPIIGRLLTLNRHLDETIPPPRAGTQAGPPPASVS